MSDLTQLGGAVAQLFAAVCPDGVRDLTDEQLQDRVIDAVLEDLAYVDRHAEALAGLVLSDRHDEQTQFLNAAIEALRERGWTAQARQDGELRRWTLVPPEAP